MGVQDRDWWKEKYDSLNGRRAPPPLNKPKRSRSDEGTLKLTTVVLVVLVVLVLCLRKAHVF